MKKFAVLTFALCILSGTVMAQETATPNTLEKPKMTKEEIVQMKRERMAAFEQKLGLTDEQKAKARELRMEGHAQMKPIMDQLRQKHQDARMIKMSRMAVQAQEEKLAEIDAEIKNLEKQLNAYRKEHMKKFESILTRDQKKILKQMKKEGRQNFQKEHKPTMYSHKGQ